MPLERSIVASIVRMAESQGWWTMKIHGGPHQKAGVPDLLLQKCGGSVWFEVKQPGNHPTAIQIARMNDIENVGGCPCFVVTNKEEAREYLLQVEKRHCGRGADANMGEV